MIARLDEVFNLQMGKTPSRNNTDYWINGQYDWISIADLGGYQKYVEKTKEKISALAIQESGIKCVPANTVIMSFKLSLGKTAITKNSVYTNEAIMAFIPTGRYAVLPDYFYYLFSARDWTKGTNRAVMGTTLNKATLSAISVEVPPLDEQRCIVATLDKVSDLIYKRRQQLDKLDELVKARFVEMFGDPATNPKGWDKGTIRDVVTEVKYGTSKPAVEGGTYKYLRMGNITYDGHLDLTDLKYIDVPESELDKCTVKKGDVLFNRTNSKELVGKTCVYNLDETMVIAGYIIRVRVNNRVLPEYLSAVLNSSYGKKTLAEMCKAIVGQANINAQELQNIQIVIPPLELQYEFLKVIQKIEKINLPISRSLEKLQTLKKALMQEYFG